MARYGLFVLKVPLNPNQPTNHLVNDSPAKDAWYDMDDATCLIIIVHVLCGVI